MAKSKLNYNAVNFFLYSYLGIELEDVKYSNKDYIIFKCTQRTYMDIKRTLRFKECINDSKWTALDKKRIEKDHHDFCNGICKTVKDEIVNNVLPNADKH